MSRPKTKSKTKQITFSVGLLDKAERKAKFLGISFPEFVRHLVISNIDDELQIEELDEETSKEVGEALEEYKQGKGVLLKTKEDIDRYFDNLAKD